jgi:hypothetical protein
MPSNLRAFVVMEKVLALERHPPKDRLRKPAESGMLLQDFEPV